MNIIFFFLILVFVFNFINKKVPNNEYTFINILNKYKSIPIIVNSIDHNLINKIKLHIINIHKDNENYKYYYDMLEYDIHKIENNFMNIKKVKLLSEKENNYIDNMVYDLYSILNLCKNKGNEYYKDINMNKSLLKINNVKEYNNNIYYNI